jgi:Protein NO VEIN, C-terminal/EVE domain
MVNAWWRNDLEAERFWLESTDREDIGADLRAPLLDQGGKENWRYTLFQHARPDDTVYHYDKRRGVQGIIGASKIAGPWYAAPTIWAPGSYARAKGIKPHERPGYVVPLEGFTPIEPPLRLEELRAAQERIEEALARVRGRDRGALYFPFETGRKRPLRLLKGYSFKLPRLFLDVFPQLRLAFLDTDAQEIASNPPASNARARRAGGQGFGRSADANRAGELRAMEAAVVFFEAQGFRVEDTSATKPYDLRVANAEEVLTVEVKGTTGDGSKLILTDGEVRHARSNPGTCVLFILTQIELGPAASLGATDCSGTSIKATGGRTRLLWPWNLDADRLRATQYIYEVPAATGRPPTGAFFVSHA